MTPFNKFCMVAAVTVAFSASVFAQEYWEEKSSRKNSSDEIRTVFKNSNYGGYAAFSNKFTAIHGQFANMPEIYGGIFIGRKFLVGISGSATTNYIKVPDDKSIRPDLRMSHIYGQAGLVNEFVWGSNSPVHAVFHWFNGAGFELQYERDYSGLDEPNVNSISTDPAWYYVTEPGIQLEINLFKWMRLSPGVSYRMVYNTGIDAINEDISGISGNITLKFGKF
jgi:hypothetical protein